MKPRLIDPISNPRCAILLLALLSTVVGCGQSTLTVRGNVTYDGKPVEDGVISFDPVDKNAPTMGGKITNGAYSVTAPKEAAGKKIVRITASRKTGKQYPAPPP